MSILTNYNIEKNILNYQSNLENKERVVSGGFYDKIVAEIFESLPSAKGNGEIVVSTHVMHDGWGDHFHSIRFVKELKKKFPDREFTLVTNGAENHTGNLSYVNPKKCNHEIYYNGEEDYENSMNRVAEKIRAADLWISGPIAIDLFEYEDPIHQKQIDISEYDALTGIAGGGKYHLPMGLKRSSMGIMIDSQKKYSWESIQNPFLREQLNIDNESLSQISESLYFAYMHDDRNLQKFIEFCAEYHVDKYGEQPLTICIAGNMIGYQHFLENLEKIQKRDFIGTIKVMKNSGDEHTEPTYTKDKGLPITILLPGFLSSKDFKILAIKSAPVVGCTGDGSLSQAISYGKIPFYEEIGHKRDLKWALVGIAEKLFGEKSSLWWLLRAQCMSISNKILINPEELDEQAKVFSDYIKEHYAFNSVLKGHVNKTLYCKQSKELADKIDELKGEFLNKRMSVEELVLELSNYVNDYKELFI